MSTAGGRRPWAAWGAALGGRGRGRGSGEQAGSGQGGDEAGSRALPPGVGGLSAQRRRGLVRLGGLVAALMLLVVLTVVVLGGGDPENPNAIVYRDAADTKGPLDILSAQMDQAGPQLVLSLRTAGIWTPGQLAQQPGRSVCTTLFAKDEEDPRSKICVVSREGAPSLELTRYRDGRALAPRPMAGGIRRRNLRLLEARFSLRDAKLPLGKFRWQVGTLWAGEPGGCPPASLPVAQCADQLPDRGTSPGKVTEPLLLGCTFSDPSYVLNGPRGDRVVALTFDDGPSPYTGQVLDVLKRFNARATFFVVGENVIERPGDLQRVLREGNSLANHTFTHVSIADADPAAARQLDRTTTAMREATSFTPCLFRPPFGSKSAKSIALTKRKGMKTIGWDVDTSDFKRPGAQAITRTVLSQTKPGSIVLMHDGGGPRDQTVQALPAILRGLRAKGYRFVTVDQLLGVKGRYA
ncbi:MAG: polysaccharide deacetylase family protein [Solirubrobacteraceae bacterium]